MKRLLIVAVLFAAISVEAMMPGQNGGGVQKRPLIGGNPATWTPRSGNIGGNPATWTPRSRNIGGNPSTWTPRSKTGVIY